MPHLQNIKKLVSTEFFKYSAALLSSNFLAQVIGLLVYPFITRIYSKEIFGEFNWYLSVVGLLTLVATGRYEYAVVLPKSDKKATSLLQLCILLSLAFSILLFIPAIFFKKPIAVFFNQTSLELFFPIIPLFVLLGSLWQSMSYYFSREKKFYNISVYTVSQSIINSALKIILGLKGFLQGGLILSTFFGQFFAFIFAFFRSRFPFRKVFSFNKLRIKSSAKEYGNFPKYVLPNDLMNSLAGNLPILLLSVYFGNAEIGLFSLALLVGFRPVNMFNMSVYQVLYKKISERVNQNRSIRGELLLFCKSCSVVFLPIFVFLFFIAEWLFALLFGAEWREAGIYFKMMLPWLFLDSLVAPLGFLPDIFFRQKTVLILNLIYLTLRIIALCVGTYLGSFKLAILLYFGVSTLMMVVQLYWFATLIRKYETN